MTNRRPLKPPVNTQSAGSVPPLGWVTSLAIFAGAGALLWIATRLVIPWLAEATHVESVLLWFAVGGLGVFAPLVAFGFLLLRREAWGGEPGSDGRNGEASGQGRDRYDHGEHHPAGWAARLRFRRMDRADWAWALGGLVVVGILSGLVQLALLAAVDEPALAPPFLAFEPLSPGRYWILAAWLPFWLLNIMGEEFLWRGVLLPRQEAALGPHAWLANAAGWAIFHVAFGWHLLLMLLPIVVVLPYVTQRRRNSWVAVVIHAGLNGPAFVAVALGVV
jgi:membrane protease YdiL (CAAX protease family)